MLPQNFFIFFLFYDFYRKTYQKKPETSENEIKVEETNDIANNNNIPKMKREKIQILNYEKTISDWS